MSFCNVVTNALSRNAASGKLYEKVYTFQQRAVISIWGPCPKAKLLVLPVAKDDGTTKKGMGATMLKLWHCSGLVSKVNKEDFGYDWKVAPLEDQQYIIKIGDSHLRLPCIRSGLRRSFSRLNTSYTNCP
jgi:hypothetical protein